MNRFAPDLTELLARARADLRMGVPVVLDGQNPMVFSAAETLNTARLAAFRSLTGEVTLTITARRAETLKAPAYDGDLARVQGILPEGIVIGDIRP